MKKPVPEDPKTQRLHQLCLERMAFYTQELQRAGFFPLLTAELECFFENDRANAVHVDRQKVQDVLQQHCPHVLFFGNDLKRLNEIPHDKLMGKGLLAWQDAPGKVVAGEKHGAASKAVSLLGLSHKIVPYFAKQYEAEFAPDVKALSEALVTHDGARLGLEHFNEQLPGMLRDMSRMREVLTANRHAIGFDKLGMDAKRYSHTFGYMAAPSMHMNLSLWHRAGEYMINTFAGADMPGQNGSWLGKYEPPFGAPTEIADYFMRTLSAMQKDGMALVAGRREMNFTQRHVRGYMVPRHIDVAYHKHPEYTVCYRHSDNSPMESRVENRAGAANSDPYLVATLTLGAAWASVCKKKEFGAWVEQSEREDHYTQTYEKERLLRSAPMKAILGDELHAAACEYCEMGPQRPRPKASAHR